MDRDPAGDLRAGAETVRIVYRRPPDREETFVQEVIQRGDDVTVTFLPRTPLSRPMLVDGVAVLEAGSPVVWFTFPDRYHDIGRFHTAEGVYTGLYANVLTPVRMDDAGGWVTTDLFLDIWLPPGGEPAVLDRDELAEAVAHAWIAPEEAARAEAEAARIVDAHRRGGWPPAVVHHWTLERVREARRR